MTPEELENRLQRLVAPAPSESVRRAVLRPAAHRPERNGGRIAMAAALLICGSLFYAMVWGPQDPGKVQEEKKDGIAEWIARLDSKDIEERDRAEQKLVGMGEEAMKALEAFDAGGNAELQARVDRILKEWAAGSHRRAYEAYIRKLDLKQFSKDYPKFVRILDSGSVEEIQKALTALGELGEWNALPEMVAKLDSEDRRLRIYAGLSMTKLCQPLTGNPDPEKAGAVGFIVEKMLALPDDGNTHAYAANLVQYLGLSGFKEEIRGLLKSRHPAVRRSAANALRSLGEEVPAQEDPMQGRPRKKRR